MDLNICTRGFYCDRLVVRYPALMFCKARIMHAWVPSFIPSSWTVSFSIRCGAAHSRIRSRQ